MNGGATTESGVPALVGSSDREPGLPTHKVANPFMWLHINTHNHTRKVEEYRGKKNGGKNQGTLEVTVRTAQLVP